MGVSRPIAGSNASEVIGAVWPRRMTSCRREAVSRTVATPSTPPVANIRPSGEKATAFTAPV